MSNFEIFFKELININKNNCDKLLANLKILRQQKNYRQNLFNIIRNQSLDNNNIISIIINMCKEILLDYDRSLNFKDLLSFITSGRCNNNVIMSFMLDISVHHINNTVDIMNILSINNPIIVDLINVYLEKCDDIVPLEFVMGKLLDSKKLYFLNSMVIILKKFKIKNVNLIYGFIKFFTDNYNINNTPNFKSILTTSLTYLTQVNQQTFNSLIKYYNQNLRKDNGLYISMLIKLSDKNNENILLDFFDNFVIGFLKLGKKEIDPISETDKYYRIHFIDDDMDIYRPLDIIKYKSDIYNYEIAKIIFHFLVMKNKTLIIKKIVRMQNNTYEKNKLMKWLLLNQVKGGIHKKYFVLLFSQIYDNDDYEQIYLKTSILEYIKSFISRYNIEEDCIELTTKVIRLLNTSPTNIIKLYVLSILKMFLGNNKNKSDTYITRKKFSDTLIYMFEIIKKLITFKNNNVDYSQLVIKYSYFTYSIIKDHYDLIINHDLIMNKFLELLDLNIGKYESCIHYLYELVGLFIKNNYRVNVNTKFVNGYIYIFGKKLLSYIDKYFNNKEKINYILQLIFKINQFCGYYIQPQKIERFKEENNIFMLFIIVNSHFSALKNYPDYNEKYKLDIMENNKKLIEDNTQNTYSVNELEKEFVKLCIDNFKKRVQLKINTYKDFSVNINWFKNKLPKTENTNLILFKSWLIEDYLFNNLFQVFITEFSKNNQIINVEFLRKEIMKRKNINYHENIDNSNQKQVELDFLIKKFLEFSHQKTNEFLQNKAEFIYTDITKIYLNTIIDLPLNICNMNNMDIFLKNNWKDEKNNLSNYFRKWCCDNGMNILQYINDKSFRVSKTMSFPEGYNFSYSKFYGYSLIIDKLKNMTNDEFSLFVNNLNNMAMIYLKSEDKQRICLGLLLLTVFFHEKINISNNIMNLINQYKVRYKEDALVMQFFNFFFLKFAMVLNFKLLEKYFGIDEKTLYSLSKNIQNKEIKQIIEKLFNIPENTIEKKNEINPIITLNDLNLLNEVFF
jgi:hypothetical protein